MEQSVGKPPNEVEIPSDWHARTLGATTAERFDLVRRLKLTPLERSLCDLCRRIDWEYLLFGSSNGVDDTGEDSVFVGPRTRIAQNAASGCPCCAEILLPLCRDIDDSYPTASSSNECVYLYVNDVEDRASVLSGHRSYRLQLGLGHGEYVNSQIVPSPTGRRSMSSLFVVHVDDGISAYRSVPPSVEFSRCQDWLKTCRADHNSCKAVQVNADSPIKLIDIASHSVVSFARKGSVEYAALSYVCGPGYSVCVLQSSQGWRTDQDGRPSHPLPPSMPSTLTDALEIVQKLTLRYLWVDSICVAQDDAQEKQTQIRQMFNIYNDAAVCIVSAVGRDSRAPLCGVSTRRHAPLARTALIKQGLRVGLTLPAVDTVLAGYTYMRRAWTFQELIMSKCSLIFTEKEVFFSCAQSLSRESRAEQTGQDPGAATMNNLQLQIRSRTFGNSVTFRKITDLADVSRLFGLAAQEYSLRTLSFQEDVVDAFYGVLVLFAEILRTVPVSGCPGSLLLNALTWKDSRTNIQITDLAQRRMCKKSPNTPVLPTWMWCSYDAPIELPELVSCYTDSVCHIYNPQWNFSVQNASMSRFYSALCQNCSILSHTTPVHLPMPLPTKTRAATLHIHVREKDQSRPGLADLFTNQDKLLGSCDFRGQCDVGRLNGSEVTLMQLHSEHGFYSIYPNVTVLMLETCKLEETVGASEIHTLQNSINLLLQPEHRLAQIEVEAPDWDQAAQREYRKDDTSASLRFLSHRCPHEVQIHHTVPLIEDALVGSRLGIASIIYDEWIMLKPKESLIILV